MKTTIPLDDRKVAEAEEPTDARSERELVRVYFQEMIDRLKRKGLLPPDSKDFRLGDPE